MIKEVSYKEQREQFLTERLDHNLFLCDTWTKMAEGTEYNSLQHDKAAQYGAIASFYRDAIDAINELEARESAACPFCHAGENGNYAVYQFTNEQRPEQKATVSFYDGQLTFILSASGAETDICISTPIHYCPVCGRKFDTTEAEQ